ncbi:MAG: PepSY domain-containing protein [Chthoniobacterales bacterium]
MKPNKLWTTIVVTVALAGLTTSALFAADKSEADLLKEAKITKAQAEETALAKVPGGKIDESELEEEHGKLVWSFDIATPGSKNITEVQVDAKTGEIVEITIENLVEQAKEGAADKKDGQR